MCFILLNIYTRTYQTPRQSKYLVILPCYVFSFVTCISMVATVGGLHLPDLDLKVANVIVVT